MAHQNATPYRFKLGMNLTALGLPFEESLTTAKEIGAEYVWFDALPGLPPIVEMSDAEIDDIGKGISDHGLKLFLIGGGTPFKFVHLADLELERMETNAEFAKDLKDLVRSMEIAGRLGVDKVCAYAFAWPGEYSAGKPTWPMRWLTQGGVIADVDMEKLVKALSLALDEAESHDVDLVLAQMCWNYNNTTGNFRRIAERVGSPRLKLLWGPADNLNCGELDVASTGFDNVRPYLMGLHTKDLRVIDGINLNFEYLPFGEGDVGYPTLLGKMLSSGTDAVLAITPHYLPPGGTAVDAMRTCFASLQELATLTESRGVSQPVPQTAD